MTAARIRNAYQQSESQVKIHPVKLVDMMYTRILSLLTVVEEGVLHNDAKVRGENLGKVIAILTELNFSIKDNDSSETAQFLRGLYSSILVQLPTVVINNDVKIVRQTAVYINKLKEIWGQTAMREAGFTAEPGAPASAGGYEASGAGQEAGSHYGGGAKAPGRSLSVSI